MGSFYTESSYNFGTNSAQFPADRERCQGETAERYKGEAASGTREKPRAAQGRGRERYKGEDASGTRERPRNGTRKTRGTVLRETGRMIPCLPQYRPPFVYGQSEESFV